MDRFVEGVEIFLADFAVAWAGIGSEESRRGCSQGSECEQECDWNLTLENEAGFHGNLETGETVQESEWDENEKMQIVNNKY